MRIGGEEMRQDAGEFGLRERDCATDPQRSARPLSHPFDGFDRRFGLGHYVLGVLIVDLADFGQGEPARCPLEQAHAKCRFERRHPSG